jgi:hypothetical protein
MRKRTVFASITAAAMTAAAMIGTVAIAPTASGAESATTAASWSCSRTWHDDPAGITVACSYGGKVRGVVAFWRDDEPEELVADDGATDHRAVIAKLTWTQNGQTKRSTVRSAGPRVVKEVAVPEGTKVWLSLCLEGHSCGPQYAAYA